MKLPFPGYCALEEPWPADAHSDDDDDARDDDSDDDAADITPTVQRFEPGLLAAEAKPKLQRFKTSKPSKRLDYRLDLIPKTDWRHCFFWEE